MHLFNYQNRTIIVFLLALVKNDLAFSPVQRHVQNVNFKLKYGPAKINPRKSMFNQHTISTVKTELNYAWGGDRYGDGSRSSKTHNIKRTCIRHFLTQRSVQSFMFLCDQFRDPHTVKWIEEFSGAKNLLSFHGTGAFNLTRFENWDSFLFEMMERDKDTVVVRSRVFGAVRQGWSKNNPYAKPSYVEFNIDIDPHSLTTRILSVREQIAEEWKNDLDIVIRSGEIVLDSYMDNVFRQREEEEEEEDSDSQQGATDTLFDRAAMSMMNNINSFNMRSASPLRKSSFDLLMLLATQESVHRVLRNLKETAEEPESGDDAEAVSASFEWLREFYTDRVETFFDGHQRSYGRYDDFLEELLRVVPHIKTNGGKHKNSISLIDPLGLAEQVIRTRGEVAREWKEIVSAVPEEHLNLRRKLLGKQINMLPSDELENVGEFE